ncbi:MAG: protease modulator HflC [Candidatus Scalindua sp.]|nr:protease modulator HflC [Candidatus Scalindua sp.]
MELTVKKGAFIFLFMFLLFGFFSGLYVIDEKEQVVITQFGKIRGEAITDAGVHLKIPYIQNKHVYDKRILEWDGDAEELPTKDNKYVFIDVFARWRISDPQEYHKAVGGRENQAQSRIDDVIDGSSRDIIAEHVMSQIVRSSNREMVLRSQETSDTNTEDQGTESSFMQPGIRDEIVAKILAMAQSKLAERKLGIEIIDVQLKRVNFTNVVKKKIQDRMVSEQSRIAQKYRAQGQKERQELAGRRNNKIKNLMSEAYNESEMIKGTADATATKIYAEAYGADPDFYNFVKSLETLEKAVTPSTNIMMTSRNGVLKVLFE